MARPGERVCRIVSGILAASQHVTAPSPPSPNPIDAGLYRGIWRYAAGARVAMTASMGLLMGSQALRLAVPWFAAQAIDALQKGGTAGMARALEWVLCVMGASVASWMLHGPGRVLERRVGMRVRETLSDELYTRLTAAPLAWHDRHHSNDMQQRVRQSTQALYEFSANQFIYLQSLVGLVGPLVALAALSPVIGLAAFLAFGALALVSMRIDRTLMRLSMQEMEAERRYASGMADFLGHIGTVLSLRLQDASRRLLQGRLARIFVPLGRNIVVNEAKWCMVDLVSTLVTWALVVAFVWLQSRNTTGVIAIGAVFMVQQYASRTAAVATDMTGRLQGLSRTRADYASARPIFDAPEAEPARALPADWRRIVVRDIAYRHASAAPDSPPLGLDELALARGERIALVGGSGAGKSTLMRVLAGLYAAPGVVVEVDGVVQAGVHSLAAIATLIPQEADVFEGSVRENLDFGTALPDVALAAAMHGSAFDAVLSGLDGGLDFAVAERGSNLSGGQRQRLCLARGALAAAGSSVIFLDEPTGALDPITEARIHDNLGRTFPSACIVASVHRMSLLAHFDRVALMEAGRLVDIGPLAELRDRQPEFARMLEGSAHEAEPALDGAAD
jgi:ABC-type multidrug transport system fused ATPase/permease subunit